MFMQNEKSSLSPIDIKYLIVNIDEKNVDNILFIHAASDCDRISPLYGKRKTKLLENYPKFNDTDLSLFYVHPVD